MEAPKRCISTNLRVTNNVGSVAFNCPQCKDYKIIRSRKARETVAKYVCPKCGFTGPN